MSAGFASRGVHASSPLSPPLPSPVGDTATLLLLPLSPPPPLPPPHSVCCELLLTISCGRGARSRTFMSTTTTRVCPSFRASMVPWCTPQDATCGFDTSHKYWEEGRLTSFSGCPARWRSRCSCSLVAGIMCSGEDGCVVSVSMTATRWHTGTPRSSCAHRHTRPDEAPSSRATWADEASPSMMPPPLHSGARGASTPCGRGENRDAPAVSSTMLPCPTMLRMAAATGSEVAGRLETGSLQNAYCCTLHVKGRPSTEEKALPPPSRATTSARVRAPVPSELPTASSSSPTAARETRQASGELSPLAATARTTACRTASASVTRERRSTDVVQAPIEPGEDSSSIRPAGASTVQYAHSSALRLMCTWPPGDTRGSSSSWWAKWREDAAMRSVQRVQMKSCIVRRFCLANKIGAGHQNQATMGV